MSDIATFTWWASVWDTTSVVAAAFVLIGVLGESIADFDALAIWTGLASRPTLRRQVEKSGLLILIVALAVEIVAAIGSHNANDQIIATLNAEAGDAMAHAGALGVTIDNLHDFVAHREQEAEKRLSDFKKFADEQKKQNDVVIADLQNDESRLSKARDDALAAADASKTALEKMNAALNAERAIRDKMLAAITPRALQDTQKSALSAQLQQFPDVIVDVFLSSAPSADAAPLAESLLSLLLSAKWNARGVTKLLAFSGPPGVMVAVRKNATITDREAAAALVNGLNADGISSILKTGVTDSPVSVIGAYVGNAGDAPHSNLWVVIDSKP